MRYLIVCLVLALAACDNPTSATGVGGAVTVNILPATDPVEPVEATPQPDPFDLLPPGDEASADEKTAGKEELNLTKLLF